VPMKGQRKKTEKRCAEPDSDEICSRLWTRTAQAMMYDWPTCSRMHRWLSDVRSLRERRREGPRGR
jgi:hypothetical protein